MTTPFRRAVAFALLCLAACAGRVRAEFPYHTFAIVEVFSSVDGTVQFIRMHEQFGANGQNLFNTFGTTLTATGSGPSHSYPFANDTGSNTAGRDVLIGTANLTSLGVTPDFFIPAGFLYTGAGGVTFDPSVSSVSWTSLPTNGQQSLFFTPGNPTGVPGGNMPRNFNNGSTTLNVPPGRCCVATTCSVTIQVSCTGTWTGGGTCAGSPCAPATGACCAGATCSVGAKTACTGAYRRYAGTGTTCNALGTTTPCCYGDFNQVDGKTVQDLFDFLAAWFATGPLANINGGTVTVQDLFDFLAAWFAGC